MSVVISTYLRRALAVDAVASAGTALLSIVAAVPLSRLLEVPEALLRGAGLALVPFVAFVLWTATRVNASRAAVGTIIGLNAAWVAASLWLVFGNTIAPNAAGYAFIVVQALAVAMFAEFQYVGLKRAELPATHQSA